MNIMGDFSALIRLSILMLCVVCLVPPLQAQNDAEEGKGIDSGGYHISQSIEAGYRTDWINGNQDTYATFVDLNQGLRLFDYSLDMRSLDHNGLLFDSLSFTNFGYGGDPDDVSRLRVRKNKWYEFNLLFRRHKNFWDYNLLANPFNPSTSVPAVGINNSPHALDLVRRMQDYNLTLFPQSRVRLRFGFSHDRDEGPGFYTTDGGTIADFNQNYSYTTNAYHVGADFRLFSKTTISYDQFLTYFKQDNVITDNPAASGFVLPNGTPVDPGNIWSTNGPVEVLPCAAPIVSGNVLNPNCNGFLGYSQVSPQNNFMPTERLQFQSNYFRNFETSGSIGYSTSDNVIPNFDEIVNDLVIRNGTRGSTTAGPATAKRVSVNADWEGDYAVTDKLRILDSFRYNNWRIPGMWDEAETSIFSQMQPNVSGLTEPQALFNAATFLSLCPPPYTATTCPSHTSSSPADSTNGPTYTFLGQNIRSNTFQLEYDFTPRITGRLGYVYTDRTIADYSASFLTAETFYPGGAGGTAGNDYFAARDACAVPSACTQTVDPTTGDLISLTFSGPAAGNDTGRNITEIHENALLAGFTARPTDNFRVTGDFEFGYNDYAFTRISPRQMQSYRIHAMYKPRNWVNLDASFDIHENRDNVLTVNDLEHGRTYGFAAMFMPRARTFFDLGYSYTDIYTQDQICYYNNAFGPPPPVSCPASLGYVPPAVPALGFYSSKQHFLHSSVSWKVAPRVTAQLGYAGTFVGGSTTEINALQALGTLAFNFQKAYAGAIFNVYKGLSYRMTWNYYAYDGKDMPSNAIPGLAPIVPPDFNGSTTEFAFRYAF